LCTWSRTQDPSIVKVPYTDRPCKQTYNLVTFVLFVSKCTNIFYVKLWLNKYFSIILLLLDTLLEFQQKIKQHRHTQIETNKSGKNNFLLSLFLQFGFYLFRWPVEE